MGKIYILSNTFINAAFPLIMWPYISKNVALGILDELSYALTLFAFSNIFLDLATYTTTANKYKKATLNKTKNEIILSVIYIKITISILFVSIILSIINFEHLSSKIIIYSIIVHGINNYWAFIVTEKVRTYLIYNAMARTVALFYIFAVPTDNYELIYALGILLTELTLGLLSIYALVIRLKRISKIVMQSTMNDAFQQIITNLSVAQYRNIPMLLFPYFGPPEGYYSALFIVEKICRAASMVTVPLNTRNVIHMEKNNTEYKAHAWKSKDIIILSLMSMVILYFSKEEIFSYFNIMTTSLNNSIYYTLMPLNVITVTTTIFSQNLFLVSGKYHDFTKSLSKMSFLALMIIIILSAVGPKYFHFYLIICELLICVTMLNRAKRLR